MRSFGITNAAPYATAPAVGSAGDTYFNTTSKTLYLSDGTSWNAVSGGGGGTDSYVVTTTTGVATNMTSPAFTRLPIAAFTEVSAPPPFQLNANGSVTCLITGHYVITASAALVNSLAVNTRVQFSLNVGSHQSVGSGYAQWGNQSVTYGGLVTAGDVVDLQAYIDSGSNQGQVFHFSAHRTAAGAQGPAGPSGALALASWYYSNFNNLPSGGVTFNNANSTAQLILPTSPISAQNFTRHTSGGVLVGQSGKYLVEMHVSVYANRAVALSWMVGIIRVYRGGVTADPDITTIGPGTSAGWYTSVAHAVQLDLIAGDLVLFYGNPSDTCDLDTRSWLSISPIGGAKGDTGAQGIAGGPVPAGGVPNFQVVTKTGVADGVVGWTTHQHLLARPICWRTPAALLNTWTNYGGQFSVARYGKKNGMIYLQGLVNRAANAAGANITMFGMDFGYSPHGLVNGQTDLLWVPGGGGNQLVRLDFVANTSGGCNVVTSDQTGAGATTAGWCSIANVSIPMDTLTGIEQGFEYVLNGDNTTTVQPGAFWWFGTRYEVNTVTTLPAVSSGASSTVRVIFAGLNPSSIPSVGQTRDTNENNGLANSRGNGWSNLSLIAVGPYPGGPLSPRYEWC